MDNSEYVKWLNEDKTRKKFIDPELNKMGWNSQYIRVEVNSVKSNFKNNDLVFFNGLIEKGIDHFIDYLLLNEDKSPLAIIEAKRFSKDPEQGRIQARTYSKDIEKQLGIKIPIFLTNGLKWIFIDEYGVERKVSGPFSQKDLKRRHDLFITHKNPSNVKIDLNIIDRPKSVQIVRKISEHFSKCHRTALIEMATGTGKTRVSMAIIKLLFDSDMVRNVLFVADRNALVRQAKEDGFKKFFTEPVVDLRGGFDTSGRLYVSTLQSLMGGSPKFFQKFSPGFFDLIIFDEAHRSIYDRQNIVFEYFDAIKIGLTATPRERETQSTIDLFGEAIAQYSYDEAINDGILVPYSAHIIKTKVLNEGVSSLELNKFQKDELRMQYINPDTFEVNGSEFDKSFMDDETNKLIINSFMDICYKSDEGKPAKTIFFCSSVKHAKFLKNIFGDLYPNLSEDVQVITSDMYRSDDEVKRFKTESNPRIALSVGMLDTGIDIPEISNLVFIKPIFSHIRFWQMLGRGTRNLNSCKHKEWLPNHFKKDFLIIDFVVGGHSNIYFHELNRSASKDLPISVITSIFNNRVNLLEKNMTSSEENLINLKIMDFVNKLNLNLFKVREKRDLIIKIKDVDNLRDYIPQLKEDISPLTITLNGDNANVSSFILKTEKLFEYVLDRNLEKIHKIKKQIQFMVKNVLRKNNLNVIDEKKVELKRVLQIEFWEDLTFEDIEFIVEEIAPLMKYFEKESKEMAYISAEDKILDWEKIDKEIAENEDLKRLL